MFTQKGELGNRSNLTEKGEKAVHQIKSTTDKKKELLTLTPGNVADGRR
jgi:hypothetical protein